MQISKYKNTMSAVVMLIIVNIGFSSSATADVVVIVNVANDVSSIDASKIKKIFLLKKKKFSTGKKIVPVEQTSGSSVRDIFNDKVLRKSSNQLRAYWAKIIFSGKGSPPKSVADDAAVKAFVSTTDSAIGYIDSANVDDSVKVIFTIK
ncbi:MAG: phosphate ABC transporter substrate-binding protein [Thiohalomonadales bacterium]